MDKRMDGRREGGREDGKVILDASNYLSKH